MDFFLSWKHFSSLGLLDEKFMVPSSLPLWLVMCVPRAGVDPSAFRHNWRPFLLDFSAARWWWVTSVWRLFCLISNFNRLVCFIYFIFFCWLFFNFFLCVICRSALIWWYLIEKWVFFTLVSVVYFIYLIFFTSDDDDRNRRIVDFLTDKYRHRPTELMNFSTYLNFMKNKNWPTIKIGIIWANQHEY